MSVLLKGLLEHIGKHNLSCSQNEKDEGADDTCRLQSDLDRRDEEKTGQRKAANEGNVGDHNGSEQGVRTHF